MVTFGMVRFHVLSKRGGRRGRGWGLSGNNIEINFGELLDAPHVFLESPKIPKLEGPRLTWGAFSNSLNFVLMRIWGKKK